MTIQLRTGVFRVIYTQKYQPNKERLGCKLEIKNIDDIDDLPLVPPHMITHGSPKYDMKIYSNPRVKLYSYKHSQNTVSPCCSYHWCSFSSNLRMIWIVEIYEMSVEKT